MTTQSPNSWKTCIPDDKRQRTLRRHWQPFALDDEVFDEVVGKQKGLGRSTKNHKKTVLEDKRLCDVQVVMEGNQGGVDGDGS